MKNKLILGLFIILLVTPVIVYAGDSDITQAVPLNVKTKCTSGFIGDQFCKQNNVYQIYQTTACIKYSKLVKECSSEAPCINGVCTRGNPEQAAITGAAVTDVSHEDKGFFSKIWDWFTGLF